MTAPLESGMSGHRGRVATDQSNKFVGIISRVLLSKRDPSVCSCNQSIVMSICQLGKNVYRKLFLKDELAITHITVI